MPRSKPSHRAAVLPSTLALALALGAASAQAEDGRAVFEAEKCNLCHSVPTAEITAKSKSEKMKGPDLLVVGEETTAEWLASYLKKEVDLDGEKHKRDFKGSDEELQALVGWLLEQEIEP